MGRLGSDRTDLTFPSNLTSYLARLEESEHISGDFRLVRDWIKEVSRRIESARAAAANCATTLGPSDKQWLIDLRNCEAALLTWPEVKTRVLQAEPPLQSAVDPTLSGSRRREEARRGIDLIGPLIDLLRDIYHACQSEIAPLSKDTAQVAAARPSVSTTAVRALLQLRRYVREARRVADRLLQRYRSEESGVLLVEGEWGTGKSYLLGRYALARH